MPYPNEHACRIRSPRLFQPDSFRRIRSGKLSLIIGRLKGQTTTTTQSFRYPKGVWTEAQARSHCEEQEGTFEPATNKVVKAAATSLSKGIVQGAGATGGLMFVGSRPTVLEAVRGVPLAGPDGATFRDLYLGPLRLGRDQVYVTNLVPLSLGRMPTDEEIVSWQDHLQEEVLAVRPLAIVALGKQAAEALGDDACLFLPHPSAVRRMGDRGEVRRKLARLQSILAQKAELNKVEIYVDFAKADDERQIVYGVVSEPEVEDTQGDVASADEIELAAHQYLQTSRIVGMGHQKAARAQVVESYIAPSDFEMGNEKVRKGSWVLAVHVEDSDDWARVKAGALSGFSLGGYGVRSDA